MSYLGAQPTTAAFPFDQFSGNGSTTAFTLTYAPASTTSIIVAVSGVVQNPNTYSVISTTLTFSGAPPTGTNNISVLYLGLPVIGVSSPGNTAYFSSTSFTATGGQTTFTPSGSYQVGFINVIRNGATLAPADYTATNGTTVTLANACTAGDTVVIQVFNLTSISGALPLTGGTVTGATTFNSTVTANSIVSTNTTAPIQPITASVAANALTVTLNPTSLNFRSSTLGSGTVNTRTVSTAISMTVSSGSTLGTVNATASRIVVLAIDNAGTVELAVVNIAGGNQLDETNLISTTAEGGAGAADSANVIYSTTARTSVPYRVVGFIDSTQTTAGTWATAPSTIQGQGGQALAAMSSIGYGQTWQTPSRSAGTTYYNTTGKPILVSVNINPTSSATAYVDFLIDGVNSGTWGQGSSASPSSLYYTVGTFIIPSGSSYRANLTGSVGLYLWRELR
jgi:hypothetical protein